MWAWMKDGLITGISENQHDGQVEYSEAAPEVVEFHARKQTNAQIEFHRVKWYKQNTDLAMFELIREALHAEPPVDPITIDYTDLKQAINTMKVSVHPYKP